MFNVPYIHVSIPGLIFVIGIMLFLFVSANEGTWSYFSLPFVATLNIIQELTQYCMKLTVNTQLLNMLHSYKQHTEAMYISVCVM